MKFDSFERKHGIMGHHGGEYEEMFGDDYGGNLEGRGGRAEENGGDHESSHVMRATSKGRRVGLYRVRRMTLAGAEQSLECGLLALLQETRGISGVGLKRWWVSSRRRALSPPLA